MGSSESGRSYIFKCGICMEEKTKHVEMFTNVGCKSMHPPHIEFCIDCIGQHVAAKIRQDPTNVKCPDLRCGSVLEPQNSAVLAAALQEEVILRWEVGAVAQIVRSMQRNSCPFQDCRAPLAEIEGMRDIDGGRGDWAVHCRECNRIVCGQCRVPWHWGMTCKKFMKKAKKEIEERNKKIDFKGDITRATNVDYLDKKFKGLAKAKYWKRCPNCKLYVQKENGCNHILCRCRFEFCYACGRSWRWGHRCPLEYLMSTIRQIRYMITDVFSSPCICICSI